jgi:hypothetical protein
MNIWKLISALILTTALTSCSIPQRTKVTAFEKANMFCQPFGGVVTLDIRQTIKGFDVFVSCLDGKSTGWTQTHGE